MGLSARKNSVNFNKSINENRNNFVIYCEELRSEFHSYDEHLNPNDLELLVEAFKQGDPDMDKTIPFDRLMSLMQDAQLTSVPAYEIRHFLQKTKNEPKISVLTTRDLYDIFVEVRRHEAEKANIRGGNQSTLSRQRDSKIVRKVNEDKGKVDAYYSIDEVRGFARWINKQLQAHKMASHMIPIDLENPDNFFEAMTDGIVLCLMLQKVSDNLIDSRAINVPKNLPNPDMSVFKKIENLNLAINTATGIGCNTVNQKPTFIMEKNETIVLGLVWQIIRAGLLIKISLNDNPNLMRLAYDDETREDLMKLSHEELLLRWVNYHLDNNENYDGEPIKNFSKDIKDSVAYQYLMEEIQPKNTGLVADPSNPDLLERAEQTLQMADRLNCREFVGPEEIVKGHPKLNLAFVANLFNTHPNLEPLDQDESDAIVETREEKTYRNWMNSLGVKPQINYLYSDLTHGVPLLEIEDKIQPGIVNWKRVNKAPYKLIFKKIENCTMAVDLAPQLNCKIVGIRGNDIFEGSRILTLGLVWQLMRAYTISLLTQLSQDKQITDKDIVAWYNEKTGSSIRTFQDSSLSDSVGFYKILKSLKPDLEMSEIKSASSQEEKFQNAMYLINVARKMGAVVYTLPEDIVECQPKMILCLVVTLMVLEKQLEQE